MRGAAGLLSFATAAVVAVGCGTGGRVTRCPKPPAGEADAYLPSLSSSSGPAGSTVTVFARLPLFDEAGKYVGPGTPRISAYWNLDLDRWTSILSTPRSPSATVAGVRVEYLATHRVTGGCDFRMKVTIPPARPGTYPLVFLYRYPNGAGDANGPVKFRVTAG
jgi:hypothetical protein